MNLKLYSSNRKKLIYVGCKIVKAKKLTSCPFNNTNRAMLLESCFGDRRTELLNSWESDDQS